ncbi:MAG: beta-ketoacyl-ACP synthase II [Chloroflexi bacterium]|nr:beta-ketoacyl-ACP synthase II [Chloroflexota bacterium]MBP8059422.1 beta-ketoacyl-ACP synthase II [Chloroflexota bacterium]
MKRRVVITGLGTVNPLGNDVTTTWESARNGRSGIARITLFDATNYKTQIAGEVKGFDPVALFGRKEARRMDRVAQLGLAAAQEAITDAQLTIAPDEEERVGAILGSGLGGMWAISDGLETLITKGPGRVSPFLVPMGLPDTVPGMISINYHLRGPNMSIATACASSNNAIGEAFRNIERGDADVMISGGAEAGVLPLTVSGFNAMGALTTSRNDCPENASRPFDRERDGFVPGEGASILILEELEHALARGAKIYGEMLGYGTSADAYHISAPPEDGSGAVHSMRRALRDAGMEPGQIAYINAHGTSTPLNDKAETVALKALFGEKVYDIPISSSKSMHGHLMGAGSALEAVIAIKGMEAGIIPPTINYEFPDPDCDLDYVPNTARATPFQNFMSNGFGFGGHNATIIVGKYAG